MLNDNGSNSGLDMGDGTNFADYFSCSSTFASSTLSSNNTFIGGEDWDFRDSLEETDNVLRISGEILITN